MDPWEFPALEINSEFGDGAGYPGQGEMELRVWVTLSTNEIWYSPSPAHMFVTDGPELKKLTYYGLQLESVDALPNLPVGMKVIGTGDFDQNGTDDIVIRGDSDGTGPQPVKTFLWLYQGSTRTRIVRLQNPLIDYTEPLGCHDFDRDSNKEVILFNPTTNRAKRFEISRADLDNGLTSVTFTEKTSLPWNATFTKIIGIADFNWDGNLDLLLRNPQNGTIKYRYMNGLNSAWYSENRRVPLSTTFIGISGSPISGTGYVVDSVDGVAPRKLWMMYDTHYGGEYEYTGDEAYRSWKVVGFGPYP